MFADASHALSLQATPPLGGRHTSGRKARRARGPPGAGSIARAWRARLVPGPTLPEAEITPGAARVAVTATEMPKGPKQQPPEPEWIGDGESTSPTGEAGRQGGKERIKRRREVCACLSGELWGTRLTGPARATAHACNGAGTSLSRQECFWGACKRKSAGVSLMSLIESGQMTRKSIWCRGGDGGK